MTAAMQRKVMSENLKDVRHKLFVMSGKGGVGKSSVTVNLAAALAAQGFNVGILDVDLHGPSVPHLLGSHGFVRVDNEDGKLVPVSCGERLSLISIESFLEDKDAAIIWRGPKKVGAIQQFVADVKWGALDYLLIDSPPGTGDEHMTILDPSHVPDQVVEELVVLHRGALFEWRIYQGGFDLPQLGRRMAGRLLRGLYYAE